MLHRGKTLANIRKSRLRKGLGEIIGHQYKRVPPVEGSPGRPVSWTVPSSPNSKVDRTCGAFSPFILFRSAAEEPKVRRLGSLLSPPAPKARRAKMHYVPTEPSLLRPRLSSLGCRAWRQNFRLANVEGRSRRSSATDGSHSRTRGPESGSATGPDSLEDRAVRHCPL